MIVAPYSEAARNLVREATCRVRLPTDSNGYSLFPWEDWTVAYGALVDLWLREGTCHVVDAGDDVYLGFAIAHHGLVRMVYVKREFRGAGLGLMLLDAVGTRVPHCPNPAWREWRRTWPTKHA